MSRWVGANREFKVVKFQEIQKKIHNRVSLEERRAALTP
jgi:hypothetical protein